MMFFGILMLLTGVSALASRYGAPGLDSKTQRMRFALAAALVFFGTDHIVNIERYVPMMPDFIPDARDIVVFTGLCEIAGSFGLMIPRLRRLAGIMLAIYFVAVFPANIKNALDGLNVEGMPRVQWYYWIRLAFQPVAVWWALYAAEVIAWPKLIRRPRRREQAA